MMESIIICEYVTEDCKPINEKNTFFSTDFSIQVLVKMKKIQTDTNILFHWYTKGNPDVLISTYEAPIKGKETYPRFAVGGMKIPQLLLEENIKPFQEWYVLIELDGLFERAEFIIKPHSVYNNTLKLNNPTYHQAGYHWNA